MLRRYKYIAAYTHLSASYLSKKNLSIHVDMCLPFQTFLIKYKGLLPEKVSCMER